MQPLAFFAARQTELAEICRVYGVRQLRLFGSAARSDFDPARSDFDFLVDFGPAVGRNRFQQFIRFKLELERLVERPIDLVPSSSLRDPRLRIVERHFITIGDTLSRVVWPERSEAGGEPLQAHVVAAGRAVEPRSVDHLEPPAKPF